MRDAQNTTLKELRERIEAKHREAMRALDVIAAYLEESPTNTGSNGNSPLFVVQRPVVQPGTNRAKVMEVLDDWKTIRRIVQESGLTPGEVRACLYAKDFKGKVEKQRMNGKLHFRSKFAGSA